jgi:diguanylate cyclase (GGDEF)-like protein
LQAHLSAQLCGAETTPVELALLVIGLDKFHQINAMLGLSYGDEVLRAVAGRLKTLIEDTDFVARLNGDEFAIVVSGAGAAERACKLSERMHIVFSEAPLSVGARQQAIKISVGIVVSGASETADEFLGNAHLALSRAKMTKSKGHIVFEPGFRNDLEGQLRLEAELKRAVERNEFELFYQPKVNLADGRLTGAEALIRWLHPERGLVSPAEFMPVVNRSAISDRVAAWVMQHACRQARLWHEIGHNVRVAVNLSPSQLQSGDFVALVKRVLGETGCMPSLLELEVTEDILLVDDDKAIEIFRQIQGLGVRIVLDDFGTGYASLSYLKKFPIDGLKIDRTFVQKLKTESHDAAIVDSTVRLSNRLGLSVVAEGIEDRDTSIVLASMGCREGQGFYFGEPMPAAEFERKFLFNDASAASAVPPILLNSTAA